MDAPDLDLGAVFLEAMDTAVVAAVERIGDDPAARFKFRRRLLAIADEEAVRRRL